MLCLNVVKIMPGSGGCQGFVLFFYKGFIAYFSIGCKLFRKKSFKSMKKIITLL